MLLTLLYRGRQSRMENINFALPSGSSGRHTPSASTIIWYKHFVNRGSGNSRRKSLRTPVITLMSGTLSGVRSTDLLFLSNASRRIRFFVAEPHSLYKPAKEIKTIIIYVFLPVVVWTLRDTLHTRSLMLFSFLQYAIQLYAAFAYTVYPLLYYIIVTNLHG